MCGRITQKSSPRRLGLGLVTVNLIEPLYAPPPKYNGAPSQEHWVIRQNPKTGERVEVPAKKVPYFKPSKELRDLVNPSEAPAAS